MNQYRIRLLAVVLSGGFVCGFSNPILAQSSERLSKSTYPDAIPVKDLKQNTDHDSDECSVIIDCDTTETQKLTDPDPVVWGRFGTSVSISGDRMIVGAQGAGCENGVACGAAYIYRFDGHDWVVEQKLIASDADETDFFGHSVSIDGNRAVVGSFYDACIAGDHCGSAYVFQYDDEIWVEQQRLVSSDIDDDDRFGDSVAISGDIIVVGASSDDADNGPNRGAVYYYRFDGSEWVEQQKLVGSDMYFFSYFGHSISISGHSLVVGAASDSCVTSYNCGAAYIFRFDGTTWVEEQKLTSADLKFTDQFGISVSISGHTVIVGAQQVDCAFGKNCGTAYIFHYDGSNWVELQRLTASDTSEDDHFGNSVSLTNDYAVVGNLRGGSVYFYQFDGDVFHEKRILDAPVHTLALSDDYVIVGYKIERCSLGDMCGAVYSYDITDDDCNCDGTADVCELDTDEDGLIDECDSCPESMMDETIIFNDCDTDVTNTLFDDGCTMADELSECVSDSQSRGRDVSCVSDVARSWLRDRLITGREYSRIVSCAVSSNNQRRNVGFNIQRHEDNSNSKRQQP